MADNSGAIDNGANTDYGVATDKVTYSGDADQNVQLQRPVHVTGSEGSKTVVDVTDANGVFVGGSIAHDGVDAGNPVKIGGKARTAEPTAVAASDRVDAYFDANGRLAITEPTRTNTASLDLTTLNATAEVDLDGKRAMAFRLTDVTGAGAIVKFEVQAPGTGLWFFCASFNIVNAEASGIGTGLSNNFENETAINGVWIATGLGGFRKFRVRVSDTGTGTATLDWSSTAAADYGFNHVFGDLQDDTPMLAHWPVMIGGISHTESMPNAEGASANWDNLGDPVSASNDRTTLATTRFRELRVMNSDHALTGTINADSEHVTIPVEGAQGVAIRVSGTYNPGSTGLISFQASWDGGTTFIPTVGFNVETFDGIFYTSASMTPGTSNASGTFIVLAANGASHVRVIHVRGGGTAFQSGTCTVTIRATPAPPIQWSLASGDKAHDAADATSTPLKIGGRAESSRPTTVADADRVNAWFDTLGRQVVVVGSAERPAVVAHESASNQTDTELIAAPGADLRIVIYGIVMSTGTAGTALLESGTATRFIGRLSLAANGGWSADSAKGWMLPENTSLTLTTTTGAGPFAVSVNYAIEQDLTAAGIA